MLDKLYICYPECYIIISWSMEYHFWHHYSSPGNLVNLKHLHLVFLAFYSGAKYRFGINNIEISAS